MDDTHQEYLHGVVDMGSNGVRCSITDLHPNRARLLPMVFFNRSGISLYDAQWDQGKKVPLPESVIEQVKVALLCFSSICDEFGVPAQNRIILATEATRTALNSELFVETITKSTKFPMRILSQKEEATYGALGIASSCNGIASLTMDLGGGSCQLGWIVSDIDGEPNGNDGVSLPFGAAALSRLMDDPTVQKSGEEPDLCAMLSRELSQAHLKLDIPKIVSKTTIKVTGGGFRGSGYRIMNGVNRKQPYPIPIINGFTAWKDGIKDSEPGDPKREIIPSGLTSAQEISEQSPSSTFGISKRRAAQYPAVAVLFEALQTTLPDITSFEFVQGGVREGYLWSLVQNTPDPFSTVEKPIMASSLSALEVATRQFRTPSHQQMLEEFLVGIPEGSEADDRDLEPLTASSLNKVSFLHRRPICTALVSLSHVLSLQGYGKDSASSAALYLTLHGFLAASHGLSHVERALISLALSARYGLEFPVQDASLHSQLEQYMGEERAFWARYAGYILKALADAYPRGRITKSKLTFRACWNGRSKNGRRVLELDVVEKGNAWDLGEKTWIKQLRKLSKDERWARNNGVKIVVKDVHTKEEG